LSKLTASQLAEWQAYATLEPFETEKSDYKMAFLSSLLTNLVIRTMGKKGAKLTSITDFEFKWDPEESMGGKPQQSIEQMKEVFQSLASASKKKEDFNNKRLRRKPKRLKK